MKYNHSKGELTTKTYNRDEIEASVGNIYKSVSIIAKRANQINAELKDELAERLKDFETFQDTLEDVFENKEQIELSKLYESLPKPHAIAVQEWLEGKIYHRDTEDSPE